MLAQGSVELLNALVFLLRAFMKHRSTPSFSYSVLAISIATIGTFSPFATAQVRGQSDVQTITVTGQRLPSASAQSSVSGISDAPITETPISIGVITSEQLKSSGATTLSSALRTEPSVSDSYNTTGYIESLSIRGFLLNNMFNYRRDGMPISNHSPLALENKERIEVLKGTSGLQSGVSAPGGLVNYVIKRPTATAFTSLGLQLSERGTFSLLGDTGGRSDDKSFGYRLNASVTERKPAADNAKGDRQFISGFFDYRLPNQGVLEWEFEHSRVKQISVPGYGLIDANGTGVADTLPRVPSPRLNLNSQTWSQPFESKTTIASIRYEQPIVALWKVGIRAAAQRIRTNDRLAFPDGCGAVYPGLCANGDVDVYDFRSENEKRKLNTVEAYLKGDVQTGAIKHELNFGVRTTGYSESYEPNQAYNYVGTINAFAPTPLPADATKSDKNTLLNWRMKEVSITDAMQIGNAWSMWWGVKHSTYTSDSVRTDGSRAVAIDQTFTTPWLAIGYKPWQGGYVYASTGKGIEPEVVPNRPTLFKNAGQTLPALKSKQIELGFKQAIRTDSNLNGLLTATLFSIEKPFADDVTLPGDTLPTRIAGTRLAKHRGLELGYAGAIAKDWSAYVQASLIDAKQVKDANGLYTDKRTTNVAPFSIAAGAAWQLAPSLQWRNSFTYFSSKPVTRDNSVSLPAGYQFDTAVTYTQKTSGSLLTWRAGIDNVFDKRYWREAPTQYWGGTYLFAASPRTLRLSVASNF
jgi:iron complex outermembrane recepter protein